MPVNRLFVASFGLACLIAPSLSLAQGGGGGGGGGGDRPRQRGGGGGGGGNGGGNQQPPGDRGGGPGGGGGGMGGGGFMRGFGGGDPMSPSIDSRELDHYGKSLSLTPEQKDMARTLFDGYQEQFRVKADEARAKMDKAREEARDSGDMRGAFQSMAPIMADLRASKQKMEDQFFNDFKAVLTPEQTAKWPALERERRRDKTMNVGRLSGERMDLFKLVEQQKYSDEVKTPLNPTLEQYGTDLDRELVNRNKVYDEVTAKMTQIGMDFQDHQDEMQKMLERGRDASVKVRELNRRYARQIEGQLPENLRSAWDKAVKEANFPDVYRQSGVSRQITSVLGFSDLTAEQKTSVDALNEAFTRDLDAANEKLAQATEKNEMTVTVDRLMRRFGGGDNSDDPTAEPRKQKRELETRTTESLHKLLTSEQVSRLPATNRGGGQGGGGNNDNQNPRPRRTGGGGDNGGDTPRRPNRGGGGGGGR